jgi:hypothetical protein
MSNLMKGNRFIRFLGGVSPTVWRLLSLIIFTSTLLIWVLFFCLPVDLEIKKNQLLYKTYLERRDIYHRTIASNSNLETEQKKLNAQFASLCVDCISSEQALDKVLISLKQNDLTCIELNPLENKTKSLWDKEYFQLKASGNFLKILSFFEDFRSNKNMKFKEVEFLRKQSGRVLLDAKICLAYFNK